MRISVVIPTHNRPAALRACIGSVLAQTYPHDQLEIIVVATEHDVATEIVKDIASHSSIPLRCINPRNDPTRGRSASIKRNCGVENATGTWIAFIDDDCVADPSWIAVASVFFADTQVSAIEGEKQIPVPEKPTRVYYGLLRFTVPNGYQTCNMLFRREEFLKLGGFDLNLPFYYEDSDIAWTFLEAGHQIPFAKGAIVKHPVSPTQPWHFLEDAKRTVNLPYLFRKHPAIFRKSGMRALRNVHWVYLFIEGAFVASLLLMSWKCAIAILLLLLVITGIHCCRIFKGCSVTAEELFIASILLPIVPVVRLVQLIRGDIRYKSTLFT